MKGKRRDRVERYKRSEETVGGTAAEQFRARAVA